MKRSLKDYFSRYRKTLYMILSIVMISILTLTVAYAALSTTLNISGNAEVSAANWDIYLDNVQLNSNSATTNVPTISSKTTASFSTTLSKPGDFYEFTIDIINDGTIDAMIDSVTKTPDLSDTQKKYLNYIVEYQNGEAISTKQLVSKNSFVRLKIKVEFRKDMSSSDLPTTSETLNLSFTVNYIQSDESGIGVENNGIYDQYKVGNEICYGTECFYVISSSKDSVTMLAKYNITTENTPLQSKSSPIVIFSYANYWNSNGLKAEYGTSYPAYVYDSNSSQYTYVEKYKTYLESQGLLVEEARFIKYEELEALGCSIDNYSCKNAAEWVYSTSYYSGTAKDNANIITVASDSSLINTDTGYNSDYAGIRPVITLKL